MSDRLKTLFLSCACLCCLFSVVTIALGEEKHSVRPRDGMVPDRVTAIRIAEAALFPIYGEETIKGEYPLNVNLDRGVWTVEGTLPEGMLGGVAVIEISKENGCILRVSHGK